MVTAFTIMYTYGVGMYQKELSSFFKTFLFLTIFTLRNSLFDDLDIFDNFTLMLFVSSYLILISIVGIFLQVLFSDTVRNVFMEADMSTVDNLKIEGEEKQNGDNRKVKEVILDFFREAFFVKKTAPKVDRSGSGWDKKAATTKDS